MGSLRRSSLNLFLISLWSIQQLILTFQGLKAKKNKSDLLPLISPSILL